MNGQLNDADEALLKYLVENSGVEKYSDFEARQAEHAQLVEQIQSIKTQNNEIEEQKHGARKSPEKGKSNIRQRIAQFQKQSAQIASKSVQALKKISISPLETAIKRGQVEVVQILLTRYKMDPMVLNSEFKTTLIELAAENSIKMFDVVIGSKEKFDETQRPINTMMKVFEALQQKTHELTKYSKIINDKIFHGDQNFQVKLIQEELGNKQDSMNLSSVANLDELFQLQNSIKNSHLVQLLFQGVKLSFFDLVITLQKHLEVDHDSKIHHDLLYKLFSIPASRHNYDSMKHLLTLFPQLLTILKEGYLMDLSTLMYNNFEDIQNVDAISLLLKDFSIDLIPFCNESKEPERTMAFKQLSKPEQSKKEQAIFDFGFERLAERILQSKSSARNLDHGLNEAADSFMKSRNRNRYLEILVENQTLFQFIDIRRDTQQEAIGQFIVNALKIGSYKLATKIIDQLQEFFQKNCSVYPIDYHAEQEQFLRNYPYRNVPMSQIIRKANLKADSYPSFMGQIDTGVIDDTIEEKLSEIWEQVLASNAPIEASKIPELTKNDVIVPNSHAVLFRMFSNFPPVLLPLNESNAEDVMFILRKSIQLGGYPMVELGNTKQAKPDDLTVCQKLNSLTSKFNLKNKNGKFQTILHQMALDPTCDQELLREITGERSLIRECLNSRDVDGLTPVMIAFRECNFNFLNTVKGNNSLFVKVNQVFSEIINNQLKLDNKVALDTKLKLLKFFASCFSSLNESKIHIILDQNKKSIADMIDLLYATQDARINECFLPPSTQEILQCLGTNIENIHAHNKVILECYKLMRQRYQQMTVDHRSIIFGQSISFAFSLGKFIAQIASEASLQQLKELEEAGFDICNVIVPTFTSSKVYADKLPPFFPFENSNYYLTFPLKFALQGQPQNREVIDYIMSKMDKQLWKPFMFEIFILVGQAYGPEDKLFKEMFETQRSYMMGKVLTVEKRIKKYSHGSFPLAAAQYYNETAYQRLLLNLVQMLIKSNNYDYFIQLLEDLSRFYLCKDLVINIIKLSCRYMRPRMAIYGFFLSFKADIGYPFLDYADLMPEINTVVTIKDVQQIGVIMRCIEKDWTPITIFKKLSRELADELISWALKYNEMHRLFDIVQKPNDAPEGADEDYKYELKKKYNDAKKENHDLLQVVYHKCSADIIPEFIKQIYSLAKSNDQYYRLTKILMQIQKEIQVSPATRQFSNNHSLVRKREILSYLDSKLDKFAIEPSYYKLLMDSTKTEMIAEYLSLSKEDIAPLITQLKQIRESNEKIEQKQFVFKELQTLIGVYRTHSYSRRTTNNIAEQRSVVGNIKDLKREEVITKGENLVILWEHMHREEARRNSNSHKRHNQIEGRISDQEIKDLMMRAEPEAINFSCVFNGFDTQVFVNDFEEIYETEKFNQLTNFIDLGKMMTSKQIGKLLESLQESSWFQYYSSGIKQLSHILPFNVKLVHLLHQISFPGVKVKENNNDEEEQKQDDNDYGEENEAPEYIMELLKPRSQLMDKIRSIVNKQKTNLRIIKEGVKAAKQFFRLQDFIDILQLDIKNEGYESQIQDPVGSILMQPIFYSELRESFIVPLISSIQENFAFIFNSEGNQRLRLCFYVLTAIPVFINEKTNALKMKLLKDEIYMEHIPYQLLQLIYAIILTEKQSNDNDELIREFAPHMKKVNSLDDIRHTQQLFRLFFSHFERHSFFPKYTLPKFNPPLQYLIQLRRFDLFRFFIENEIYPMKKIYLHQLLTHVNIKTDIDLFLWAIEKCDDEEPLNDESLEIFMDALFPPEHHIQYNADSFKFLESIINHTEGKILEDYIDQKCKSPEEEEDQKQPASWKESPLHSMLQQMKYAQVRVLRDLIKDDSQWEILKKKQLKWSEGEINAENEEEDEEEEKSNLHGGEMNEVVPVIQPSDDIYRPFFLALLHQDYGSCRLLMLSDEEIQNLTKREAEILQQYLDEKQVINFSTRITLNPQDRVKLDEIESEFRQNIFKFHPSFNNQVSDYCQKVPTFNLVKKLVLFPEILRFIYFSQDKAQLIKYAKSYALIEHDHNFSLHLLYTSCGFISYRGSQLCDLSEAEALYLLETCYDFEIDSNIVAKPYSFMRENGLVEEIDQLKLLIFNDKIQEMLNIPEIQEQVNQAKQIQVTEFKNHSLDIVKISIAKKKFAIACLFMHIYSNTKENSIAEAGEELKGLLWNLNFTKFQEDLAFISLVQSLFPGIPFFSAFVTTNLKSSPHCLFYDPVTLDQIPLCNEARTLATLLTLMNSGSSLLELKPYDFDYALSVIQIKEQETEKKDEDEESKSQETQILDITKFKKPRLEIQDYKSFIEIMQALLITSKLGNQKQEDNNHYLSEVTTSVQLLSQAIKLYNKAFSKTTDNMAHLCSKLSIDEALLKPKHQFSVPDIDLYKSLLKLTDQTLTDRNLSIKFTFNDLPLYLTQESSDEFYPKTQLLCDLFVHILPNWLLNFAPSTPLSLDISLYHSKQDHLISKIDDSTFKLTIDYKSLTTPEVITQILASLT